MSRTLYGEILRGQYWIYPSPAELYGMEHVKTEILAREGIERRLKEATRFEVSSVSELVGPWMDERRGELYDFPCIAPPFETMWLECGAAPPRRDVGPDYITPWRRLGMLACAAKDFAALRESVVDMTGLDIAREQAVERGWPVSEIEDDDGWIVIVRTFWDWSHVRMKTHLGELVMVFFVGGAGNFRSMSWLLASLASQSVTDEDCARATNDEIAIFGTALSFMHCKNVYITDAPDRRTRQQRRADERKGEAVVSFKTLQLGPMREVLEAEGNLSKNGLRKALHICRGHFAEYSPEKPLFGKYSGRFWIPAHVRGSADAGRIVKDYRVVPPAQNGEAA